MRKSLSCGNSSVDRALAFQAGGRGFESRFPLQLCCNSSVVEHFLGKEEVLSSTLSYSSTFEAGYHNLSPKTKSTDFNLKYDKNKVSYG